MFRSLNNLHFDIHCAISLVLTILICLTSSQPQFKLSDHLFFGRLIAFLSFGNWFHTILSVPFTVIAIKFLDIFVSFLYLFLKKHKIAFLHSPGSLLLVIILKFVADVPKNYLHMLTFHLLLDLLGIYGFLNFSIACFTQVSVISGFSLIIFGVSNNTCSFFFF